MSERFENPFAHLEEATIGELQAAMASGQLTARQLAEMYLERIQALDRSGPTLNSILEVNPDALEIADALDQERQAGGSRGPLHGIPLLLKDNIATADHMQTTAGSLALLGSRPPRDAFGVGKLSLNRLVEWLERARWAGTQSICPRPHPLRLKLGISGSRSGESGCCIVRHRDGWLDPLSGLREWSRWYQSDSWPHHPRGGDPCCAQPG